MIPLSDVINKKSSKINKEKIEHDLKDKYVSLLNDNVSKKIIDSIHESDDVLIKYAYDLEEVCIEHKNCSYCKGINSCKNKVCGFRYSAIKVDNVVGFSYEMCKYKKELVKNINNKNMYSIDVPEQIKNASMSDVYLDERGRAGVIKAIKKFIDNYGKKQKGIYVHGNFGGGKTYLISALFNELGKKGVKSAIVYYPEFLRNLKNFSEDFDEKFNYIKKVPLLLFDDIGAENVTGWNRDEILGPILQYRMEANLPTFFTSNLNIEELEEHFSMTRNNEDKVKARRIIERILVTSDVIEMIAENKRN